MTMLRPMWLAMRPAIERMAHGHGPFVWPKPERRWPRWAIASVAMATALVGAARAIEPTDLQPGVMEELHRTGLISEAVPVAAFRWLVENKRPMRKPRRIEETFKGQAAGLSPVARRIFDSAGKPESSAYISVRGLIRLDAEDRTIAATIDGMKLPLLPGREFTVAFTRDGHPVRQRCVVGPRESASTLHAQLPGTLLGIDCKGDGRYAGMKVKVNSRIDFIESLGVFFDRQDVLDSPLGRFENTNRIVEFIPGTSSS